MYDLNSTHMYMILLSIGQSQIIIIILGGLLGLTTFAVLILSLAMIVILRNKGKRIQEYYYYDLINAIKVKQSLRMLYLILKKLMTFQSPQKRIQHMKC